jgi:hypothetical protein
MIGKFILMEVIGNSIQNKTNITFDTEQELKTWLLTKFENSTYYNDFNQFIKGYIIFSVDDQITVYGKQLKWEICIEE